MATFACAAHNDVSVECAAAVVAVDVVASSTTLPHRLNPRNHLRATHSNVANACSNLPVPFVPATTDPFAYG